MRPIVPVSDKPTEPHEAVRWPEGVLAAARADGYGRLVVEIVGNRYLNGEVIRLDGGLRMAPK